MKRYAVLPAILAALVLTVTNCGDDECPICPKKPASPALYAIGSAGVDGIRFEAQIDVYDVNGTGDKVESAYVDGDHSWWCIRDIPHTVANDGRQIIASLGSPTCPSGLIMEFYPGETTEFTLFCRGVAHTARLHLLDVAGSMPGNLQASADDTSDQVQISWDAVADAEWYAVRMRSKFTAGLAYTWSYYCLDSTSVVAPLPFPYQVTRDVQIYVAAGSGPMPTNEGPTNNISGDYITGAIYSVSNDAYVQLLLNPITNGAYTADEPVTPPTIAELLGRQGRTLSGDVSDR
jgi:hypothetical protein